MTEKGLDWLADNMPSILKERLAKGYSVSYMDDKYPGLLLQEHPNGRLESIDININSGETIILEILREANEPR